jgi:hypothetical protein
MNTIVDIARDGRRYGVGVGFLCNNPYDLNRELLAQCPLIVPLGSFYLVTNYPLLDKSFKDVG